MPKYTTYKSIYETAVSHNDTNEERVFSISTFLHRLGLPKYHLTRAGAARARLAVVVLIGLFVGTGVVHAFQGDKSLPEARSVIVSSGDTLWSIAESYKPESADTRVYIAGIRQKNGLNGSEIHAGDELILPNF